MPTNSTIRVRCPTCRSAFRVGSAFVGRRTKCPNCKQPFEVQPDQPAKANGEPKQKEQARRVEPPKVTHVGVNCHLCGTRMYGRLDQVGQLMKCPDCDTKTKLPPPEPPKQPVVPAAMLGEQYELYEGEDQPWGVALAAEQAELVAVHCELCDTRQHVAPAMVGSAVVCPDCGHATRVRAGKAKPPKQSFDREELELEPAVATIAMDAAESPALYTRLQDFESKSAEDQEREIARVATNRHARPRMPRRPLVSGWKRFLAGPGVIGRWLTLSCMLSAIVAFAAFAFSMIFSGFGAIAGLPLMCGAAGAGAIWFGALAASAVTIVTESSEGNDEISDWPSVNPTDWMGEAIYLLVAGSASAAPGYLIAQISTIEGVVLVPIMLASAWLLFPVIHLSTLEASSPFMFLMPGVLGSLREWIGTWVLFYLLSGLLFAATMGVLMALASGGAPWLLMGTVPVVGAIGVYFRLVGRLAWRIRDHS